MHLEDPSIPLNLYNQILDKYYTDIHFVTQNILRKIYNFIKDYLDIEEDFLASTNSKLPTPTPEPKLESSLTINGHKIDLPSLNG